METPYEALDEWDDKPLREWMRQYTNDQGVIDLWEFLSVLECMTDDWYDHSASDNLYVRKMHYSEARMAGYSFWPKQGWDGMFQDLHDAVIENGGEVLLGTPADSVIIENGEVKGVMLGRDKVLPNEFMEGEVLEADAVISTLPVWNVLRVVPESALPDWYTAQIKFLAQDHLRISWIGLYLATREEVHALDPREISTWLHAPTSRLSGFCFNQSAMDPSTAPEGVNLMVAGGIIPGAQGARSDLRPGHVRAVRERPEDDVPGAEGRLLAPPAPGPRPVVRRDPEARAGRQVPAALAGAQRRRAVLRVRDVPVARHRRRPRRPCRPHRRRGLPRPAARRRLRLALLMARLEGRVALVTGAASGIGYAIAARLVAEGASVLVNDRNAEACERAAAELGGVPAVGDVTDSASVDAVVALAEERFGRLDIVVNNAGVTRDAPIHRMTDEDWQIVHDVALRGAFNVSRSAARLLARGGRSPPQADQHHVGRRDLRRPGRRRTTARPRPA